MSSDSVNRWLTLGANFGVLIGIFLLVIELNQNSTLMRAQIFNERAGQGAELFMSVAESPELSDIVGIYFGDTPEKDANAFARLTETQKIQFRWFLRAERYRIENLLYQQILGVLEFDGGPIASGRGLLQKHEAMVNDGFFGDNPPTFGRLRRLILDAEKLAE